MTCSKSREPLVTWTSALLIIKTIYVGWNIVAHVAPFNKQKRQGWELRDVLPLRAHSIISTSTSLLPCAAGTRLVVDEQLKSKPRLRENWKIWNKDYPRLPYQYYLSFCFVESPVIFLGGGLTLDVFASLVSVRMGPSTKLKWTSW